MRAKTLKQKAEAALGLLLGMRLPQVARALGPHGFGPAVMAEGFELLRRLTVARGPGPGPGWRVTGLADLEQLQSWFPVARRVLQRSHPEVAEALLHGVRRVRGPQVHLTTRLFFDRLDQLEAGDPSYGPRAAEALAVLAARGLDGAERERVRRVLDHSLEVRPERIDAADFEREAQALDELWRWYLEWSTICRRAVTSYNGRQSLGLEAP